MFWTLNQQKNQIFTTQYQIWSSKIPSSEPTLLLLTNTISIWTTSTSSSCSSSSNPEELLQPRNPNHPNPKSQPRSSFKPSNPEKNSPHERSVNLRSRSRASIDKGSAVAIVVAVAKATTSRDLMRRGDVATVLPVRVATGRGEGKETAEISGNHRSFNSLARAQLRHVSLFLDWATAPEGVSPRLLSLWAG